MFSQGRFFVAVAVLSVLFSSIDAWGQSRTAPRAAFDDESPTGTTAKATPPKKDEMKAGWFSSSISGPTGLFRVITSDIGRPHTFRFGLTTEMFSDSDMLIKGDKDNRFIGTLSMNYTPWTYIELFVSTRSQSNSNERTEAGRLDQPVILSLGDIGFGAKGQYPLDDVFSVGGNIEANLLNSVGGTTFNADATSVYFGLLGSMNMEPMIDLPIRVHLNAGYHHDQSKKLANFTNFPLSSMLVEKFALNINPSRLQFKLGIDVPLRKLIDFGLTPIIEVNTDYVTDDVDADINQAKFMEPNGPLNEDKLNGRWALWTTFGVRANVISGLNVSLGTDIGFVSPGFGFGQPVMPWNIIFGIGYSGEPESGTMTFTCVEKSSGAHPCKKEALGRLRGRVTNATSGEPIEGALITYAGREVTSQATDPDGNFLSYELPTAKVTVLIRHPQYLPAKFVADFRAGQTSSMDIKLTPLPPRSGKLTVKVTNPGGKILDATVEIQGKDIMATKDGLIETDLKSGTYTIQVASVGYIRKEQTVNVPDGGNVNLDIILTPKAKSDLVKVTAKAIVIKQQVFFATGTADITENSEQILDAVAQALQERVNIKKVEVSAHTDNVGGEAFNMKLSQQRAEAVVAYLAKAGVASDRLIPKGFGMSRPKAPNITARNRAKNRRVEFKILEQ